MKLKGSVFAIMLFVSSVVAAQTLDRSVVATAGNIVTNSTLSLEFTIGETAVGSFTNSSAQLNTGFNQGYKEDISSVDVVLQDAKMLVYPNPAESVLHIASDMQGQVRILSLLGQSVVENKTIESNTTLQMDIAHLSPGIYVVEVSNGTSTTRSKWVKN